MRRKTYVVAERVEPAEREGAEAAPDAPLHYQAWVKDVDEANGLVHVLRQSLAEEVREAIDSSEARVPDVFRLPSARRLRGVCPFYTYVFAVSAASEIASYRLDAHDAKMSHAPTPQLSAAAASSASASRSSTYSFCGVVSEQVEEWILRLDTSIYVCLLGWSVPLERTLGCIEGATVLFHRLAPLTVDSKVVGFAARPDTTLYVLRHPSGRASSTMRHTLRVDSLSPFACSMRDRFARAPHVAFHFSQRLARPVSDRLHRGEVTREFLWSHFTLNHTESEDLIQAILSSRVMSLGEAVIQAQRRGGEPSRRAPGAPLLCVALGPDPRTGLSCASDGSATLQLGNISDVVDDFSSAWGSLVFVEDYEVCLERLGPASEAPPPDDSEEEEEEAGVAPDLGLRMRGGKLRFGNSRTPEPFFPGHLTPGDAFGLTRAYLRVRAFRHLRQRAATGGFLHPGSEVRFRVDREGAPSFETTTFCTCLPGLRASCTCRPAAVSVARLLANKALLQARGARLVFVVEEVRLDQAWRASEAEEVSAREEGQVPRVLSQRGRRVCKVQYVARDLHSPESLDVFLPLARRVPAPGTWRAGAVLELGFPPEADAGFSRLVERKSVYTRPFLSLDTEAYSLTPLWNAASELRPAAFPRDLGLLAPRLLLSLAALRAEPTRPAALVRVAVTGVALVWLNRLEPGSNRPHLRCLLDADDGTDFCSVFAENECALTLLGLARGFCEAVLGECPGSSLVYLNMAALNNPYGSSPQGKLVREIRRRRHAHKPRLMFCERDKPAPVHVGQSFRATWATAGSQVAIDSDDARTKRELQHDEARSAAAVGERVVPLKLASGVLATTRVLPKVQLRAKFIQRFEDE